MELTKEQLSKANDYLLNGKLLVEISREFNIAIDTFKLQFLTAGYKLPNYRRPSYLTDDVIELVKIDIKNGLSMRTISEKRGLGNNKSLKLDLLQLGVDLTEKGEKYLQQSVLDKFLKLHNEGGNISTMKTTLKLGHDVVHRIYQHLNIKPNKDVSIYDDENIIKLKELHSQGLHNSGIGKEMGFDHKVVGKALQKLGLTPNTFDSTRKLTQEEKEIIIQKHHVEKIPYTQIAIDLKFKDSVFKRECEKHGIKLHNRCVVDLTKEELNEIVRLNIEEEHGLGMLCEKFGYTYSFLTNQLEKNNIELKRYMHGQRLIFSQEDLDKMVEFNQQGLSKDYIAEYFNTSVETLTKIIKRYTLDFLDNRFSNVTDELFESIKQRNDNGEGINKIADDLKLSYKTIASEFKKRGLTHIKYTPFFNKEIGVNDGFLHYSSELMNNLIEEYNNGSSVRELCDKYSLNKKTLRRNLVFNGVEIRDFKVTFTDEEITDILNSYNSGVSSNTLAKKYECHKGIITDILKEHNITVYDKRIYQFTEEQIKSMITKYVDFEYDAVTIGKTLNVPGHIVIKHLKLNGVETRPSNSSIPERIINRFVKGFIDKDVLSNPRDFIPSGEVDVLSHKYKIGIEYNGLLWHSDKYYKGQNVNYHLDKTNEVEANGYRLIHIFEDEYLNKEYLIFNKILELFNVDKYVGSDFNYFKMLDFKTSEEFLLSVDSLYQLKDKVVVSDAKIENTTNIEDVLVNKLSLQITQDYDKLFYIKQGNKKLGAITVKGSKLKEVLVNPVYKIVNLETLIINFIKENNIKCVTLDKRWFSETNNLFKKISVSVNHSEPKRFYMKGYKRFNDINVEHYKTHYLHKRKYKDGMTDEEFLSKCNVFSIYDCGYFTYHF
jgi:hypothetical protein